MIYVTGDVHCPIDVSKLNSKNFPEQKSMTKEDYLIILGDAGFLWRNVIDNEEIYWLNWFANKKFTTLFLEGNHENHPKLLSGITAPEVVDKDGNYMDQNGYVIERKFGGYVGKIFDSVYHLRRGEIYNIEGKKFFVMGGASSIDKLNRTQGIDWWPEEEPNTKEFNYGLDNLEKVNNTVDYILGHNAPEFILEKIYKDHKKRDSVSKFFDYIISFVNFKKFYCGHIHGYMFYEKYNILYEKVELLEE